MGKHAVLLGLLSALILPRSGSGQEIDPERPIRAVTGTGGGAEATDGQWILRGTVGQALVGLQEEGGDPLHHGFWHPVPASTSNLQEAVAGAGVDLRNFPDPFGLETRIEYTLAGESHVRLSLYDLSGRLIVSLVDREEGGGDHRVIWNGTDASGKEEATGYYICVLEISPAGSTGTESLHRKRILLLR